MIAGIGCDIVAIQRFGEKIDVLAKRILTNDEFTLFLNLSELRRPEWLAGRFAAKEAIVKAISQDLPISKISVLSTNGGKPICTIDGYIIHVSISHEKDYAIAYAIAEKI